MATEQPVNGAQIQPFNPKRVPVSRFEAGKEIGIFPAKAAGSSL